MKKGKCIVSTRIIHFWEITSISKQFLLSDNDNGESWNDWVRCCQFLHSSYVLSCNEPTSVCQSPVWSHKGAKLFIKIRYMYIPYMIITNCFISISQFDQNTCVKQFVDEIKLRNDCILCRTTVGQLPPLWFHQMLVPPSFTWGWEDCGGLKELSTEWKVYQPQQGEQCCVSPPLHRWEGHTGDAGQSPYYSQWGHQQGHW